VAPRSSPRSARSNQSNSATAGALAANDNETKQDTDQTQSRAGSGSDYTQIAGQAAANHQKADADATAVQLHPSNTAGSIRVLSPGNDGNVTQSNSTTALAAGLNDNETKQSIDQSQGSVAAPAKTSEPYAKEQHGKSKGSDYTQVAGQESTSKQKADADATAVQVKPSNTAGSIRVLSPGNDGNVTQSNDATAVGIAKNDNETKQSIDQTQPGGHGSDYTQIAGQKAKNEQKADADATAVQLKPSNTAGSIRVLSPGHDGDVTQSNSTTAIAAGLNDNETKQSIDQSQGAASKEKAPDSMDAKKDGYTDKGGSSYTQVAGQEADNEQKADADATAVQWKPSNTAGSIRVLSPGDGGDVTQSNDATAVGIAKNDNETKQWLDQTQGSGSMAAKSPEHEDARQDGYSGKGSSYTQIAGQKADSDQKAFADATAVQLKPSNENTGVRVGSKGDDGDVTQSNDATAVGIAFNGNETKQSIDQIQGGGSGSDYLQVAGQEASNDQKADADAFALQVKPSNENAPVRVLSKGHDGDVSQSNSTTAIAAALNLNETKQSIDQTQAGGGRGYGSDAVQVAGQGSWSRQDADADAAAIQLGATNEYAPVRVLSPSRGGGSVDQSNAVGALSLALNANETRQYLDQRQAGSGSLLQVGGQGSWSDQRAGAIQTDDNIPYSNKLPLLQLHVYVCSVLGGCL
jgi:hypothetical protein